MSCFVARPMNLLSGYIAQYWYWKLSPTRILPDIFQGTGVELLFNLGDPIIICRPEKRILNTGQAIVICPRKTMFRAKSTGVSQLFSVRFRSTGFFRIFGLPLTHVADDIVDVANIIPNTMIEKITDTLMFSDIVLILENWMLKKIDSSRLNTDGSMSHLIDEIYYQKYKGNISNIYKEIDISERTFQRKFKIYTGTDAKSFEKNAIFQLSLKEALSNPTLNYTNIALEKGYYDQSHYIKHFKKLTGLTPGKYFNELNYELNHYSNSIYPL
ncbi:MAG: hypothetical protein CENE_01155 [Candidatus Celerinatantimonas neptuna]|nr:MAG: hypothetical protein CENE_01155 [Candidatus Celerinatantimonas neptuna]